MKPVCVPCQRFFRPKKNGAPFMEMRPIQSHAEPGTAESDQWTDYKLWLGDLWECNGYGAQIIQGTGNYAIAEHYMVEFPIIKQKYPPVVNVNDC